MKYHGNKEYIQQRLKDGWEKTASPFLIQRKKVATSNNPQRLSKKERAKLVKQAKHKKRVSKKQKKWEKKLAQFHKKSERKIREHKVDYKEYIKSKEWRRKCNEYYKIMGRNCAACGSSQRLNMHHMNYKCLGKETVADIIPLCKEHHETYHQIYGVESEMTLQTIAFVEVLRKEYGLPKLLPSTP